MFYFQKNCLVHAKLYGESYAESYAEGHTRRSYAESYAESIRGGDCHRLVPPPSGRSGNLIRFLKAWEGFSSSGLGGVGIAQVSLIHSNSKLLKMEGIRGGHTRSHT